MPNILGSSASSSVKQQYPQNSNTASPIGSTRPINITNNPFVGDRTRAGTRYNAGKNNTVTMGPVKPFNAGPASSYTGPVAGGTGGGDNKYGLGGNLNGSFGQVTSDLTGSVGSIVNNVIDYVFNLSNSEQYSTQSTTATSSGEGGGSGGAINLTPSLSPSTSQSAGGGLSTTQWILIVAAVLGLIFMLKK